MVTITPRVPAPLAQSKTRYVFEPVLIDACTEGLPQPGTVVAKVQPYGCPRNGTMGFTYVQPVDTPGQDFFLVRTASLSPLRKKTKNEV